MRELDYGKNEDSSLFSELAKLLNVSVSELERYPADIRDTLHKVYSDNYRSDEITLKKALGQIVQLNTETKEEIRNAVIQAAPNTKDSCAHGEETARNAQEHQAQEKRRGQAILTRAQIIKNSKIIHENYYKQKQAQAQNYAQAAEEQKNRKQGE